MVQKKLREWDPIGGVPDDEYDSYAAPVVRMLDRKEKREEIIEYLREVCEDHIGLPHPTGRAENNVGELIDWWPNWRAEVDRLGPTHLIDE